MATPVPPPIGAAPPIPSSLDPEVTFDAQYEAFNAFERDVLREPGFALYVLRADHVAAIQRRLAERV